MLCGFHQLVTIAFLFQLYNPPLLVGHPSSGHSNSLQNDSTGTWFTREPLPTPRQEVAHAFLNGNVYVPGGLASGGIGTGLVEAFEPTTNAWITVAPLPEPLHHIAFAAANGKLYVLGGYTGNLFVPTNRVYEYSPDSNQWVQKTPMPVARGAHVAVEYGGKIYVIGGVQSGAGAVTRNDVYDPIADAWQNLADMPTAREHLAAAAIDSLIYVVGGRVGANNTNAFEAYSPASNTWYTRANMPTARSGLAAAALGGRLYAFGGEIPGIYPQNEEYNPATNTWRTMAPMPTPRHGIGAATVGDSIFIIGGGNVQGFGVTDVNEMFTVPRVQFAASPTMLNFGTVAISNCKRDSVKVKNHGTVPLSVSSATSTNPRFYVSPVSATIGGGDSLWFTVNFCADFPIGAQMGYAVFVHNASGSPDSVSLLANVVTSAGGLFPTTPDRFYLYPNYPNPFNPSTTIEYELPEADYVTIQVYDVLGQVVKTILSELKEPGRHQVTFDAGDLPSGVYVFQMRAGKFVADRKMTLAR